MINNNGGFITIPIQNPFSDKYPMTFDAYQKEYGVDLNIILEDDPNRPGKCLFKAHKPLYTEDVDRYYREQPLISNLDYEYANDALRIVHGKAGNSGIYMVVDWENKTLTGGEY